MRERLYDRLARGPVDRAMRLRSGQLVTRLGGDVDELSDLLVRAVLPIAIAGALGIVAVAAVATMSIPVALLLAGCLAVAGIVAPWLAGRAVVSSERLAAQHREGRDVAAMTALDYADQLRVSGRLQDVIADVAVRQTEWGRIEDVAARPAALAAATQTLAIGAAVVGAALAGISLSVAAAPTTVAVLMLLPLSAFEATGTLPAAAVTLVRARLAARRLTELVAGPSDKSVALTVQPGANAAPVGSRLEARGLVSGFSSTAESGPLDLDLPTGSRLAVVGPGGAGKTALLMTLAGLLASRRGVVGLEGTPVDAIAESHLRSRITYFAEDAHIFATTVGDNLRVVRGDAGDDELLDALSRVGLAECNSGVARGLVDSSHRRCRCLVGRAAPAPATRPGTDHRHADHPVGRTDREPQRGRLRHVPAGVADRRRGTFRPIAHHCRGDPPPAGRGGLRPA